MLERIGARLRAYAEKDGRGYPDWAMRYVPVVTRLRDLSPAARILEIGANENGFARFSGRATIAVDIDIEHLKVARVVQDIFPVMADLAYLPFRDGSVDICICMDTFEHVPDAVRPAAAAEIVRVLRDGGAALVAFPSGLAATEAETSIRNAYARYTGGRLRWLEEHAIHRLPDAGLMAKTFRDLCGTRWRVTEEKNVPVWLWRWMWLVMMCGWPGRGNAIFQALLRWLTPLLTGIRLGPCYRRMIWILPTQNASARERLR